MKQPPNLQKGDLVAIVSTARKITSAEIEPALVLLKQWGLSYVLGSSIGADDHQFAGHDALRTRDFQEALDNPNVKAIWCARGGYGTVRIIDQLDFTKFRKHPKWIVGYSDVTVLHSHLHQLGVVTLHAQMPQAIENKTPETQETLRRSLFGESFAITYENQNSSSRFGETQGILVGGNLSILYSLCGSPSALDTKGKILFLEDVDEYLYHIDRMMQNLKRNGMLHGLAGLVVGGMTQMNDNAVPFGKSAEEIIFDAVEEFDYPVCFGFPAGHQRDNCALQFGKVHTLVVSQINSLY
ncbi:MAG TPA: LD-carboxypeptidase [Flavobacteriaceae bacterium]|nr:LD-carboxypeptidase [Flavobacteriaceae bacterium]MCB9212142.1 LD-carboxypeptidase [Alteromonas sp.]HPF10479.1 LD-carboxypeptidase [Flavobacteriaceae bacterium]HQU21788.1 LD-carboxypeptidase [Flavobacteriaceae bacterium]HQU64690.1 LD-carboxypeptidase [Flavobacteriaceae bacterium]